MSHSQESPAAVPETPQCARCEKQNHQRRWPMSYLVFGLLFVFLTGYMYAEHQPKVEPLLLTSGVGGLVHTAICKSGPCERGHGRFYDAVSTLNTSLTIDYSSMLDEGETYLTNITQLNAAAPAGQTQTIIAFYQQAAATALSTLPEAVGDQSEALQIGRHEQAALLEEAIPAFVKTTLETTDRSLTTALVYAFKYGSMWTLIAYIISRLLLD